MTAFNTHEKQCTPLEPCVNCLALTFLRCKLNEQDFSELMRILGVKLNTATRAKAEKITTQTILTEVLSISTRTRLALLNHGIETMGQLMNASEAEILRIPNLGRKSLNDLKDELAKVGLYFGSEMAS